MGDAIRVVVLGTGQMGAGIARLLLTKPALQLVGVYARRTERQGLDLGMAIGLDRELGIAITTDLTELLAQTRPQIAFQATCSTLQDAWQELAMLIEHGVDVISIAEEMAYPAATSPVRAVQLQRLAIEHGVSLLGTGVNPGFVLDLLIITLTGVCAEVEKITATRVNDLSPYGPTVLREQGVGLTPQDFERGVNEGNVVGHVGFEQSLQMIAAALGWQLERIEQTREPIISTVIRQTPFVTVEPGQVAGCLHTATAYRNGKAVIQLIHPQQILPQLEGVATGDRIEIRGSPNINLAGSPEIPGGLATQALAVNMIPQVVQAAPGLYCMADLPVPAAMPGGAGFRSFRHATSGEQA
ncbi:2,4-diaminopentanoate dehydrogenase [Methylomarinum vadi]|uniref:2,4-diaminopentanoate dehydrogenase n=1 Tax=Methylomarinum vadi TaxID=438855 RepID=UPI00068A2C0B|nr:2,4-diaminopentanoate dehydrogenase [Methylomarinum vadi]